MNWKKVERAGEARFVFNVLIGGSPSSFSIIMEYELPAISNRQKNAEAKPSSFLTSAPFNDLAARQDFLAQQLGMPPSVGQMGVKLAAPTVLRQSRSGRVH